MAVRVWVEAARLLWQASRGYRLRPWRSPYLRWRVETYSGLEAGSLDRPAFLGFAWRERRSLLAYVRWAAAMRRGAGFRVRPRRPPAGQ